MNVAIRKDVDTDEYVLTFTDDLGNDFETRSTKLSETFEQMADEIYFTSL